MEVLKDVNRIVIDARLGATDIYINLYHAETVKKVKEEATTYFKLFGTYYILFGNNMYEFYKEDTMLLINEWKDNLKNVINLLKDYL